MSYFVFKYLVSRGQEVPFHPVVYFPFCSVYSTSRAFVGFRRFRMYRYSRTQPYSAVTLLSSCDPTPYSYALAHSVSGLEVPRSSRRLKLKLKPNQTKIYPIRWQRWQPTAVPPSFAPTEVYIPVLAFACIKSTCACQLSTTTAPARYCS